MRTSSLWPVRWWSQTRRVFFLGVCLTPRTARYFYVARLSLDISQDFRTSILSQWFKKMHAQVFLQSSASLWDKLNVDSSELSDCQVTTVRQLIQRNADVFASSSEDLGRTTLLEMEINTGDHAPIRQMPRRMSPRQREEVAGQVLKLLRQGVIKPSSSPWSSPIVLVKKKDALLDVHRFQRLGCGHTAQCISASPVDDTLDVLGGAKFFSTLASVSVTTKSLSYLPTLLDFPAEYRKIIPATGNFAKIVDFYHNPVTLCEKKLPCDTVNARPAITS